jgi:segregation and condensation protein B
MDDQQLKAAIEAILYVADEPVTLEQLRSAFPEAPPGSMEASLEGLLAGYNADGRGVALRFVAGGYKLSTRVECHEYVSRFLLEKPGFKLSMAALETLAIIAYRQPVTVPEVLQIRGVKSTQAVKTLLEKKLIVPRGRRKALGAPMQYGTSREFLVHFGLGSLEELPTLDEFEEIFGERAGAVRQKSLFPLPIAGESPEAEGDSTGTDQPPPAGAADRLSADELPAENLTGDDTPDLPGLGEE